jgi:hypothetical protein
VLGIDVGADAAVALRLGHHVHGQGRLTRGLRSEDLHDAAAGQAADAKSEVESEGSRRDRLDVHVEVLTHPHDRPLAELLLNLAEGHVECLVTFHVVVLLGGCYSLDRADPTGGV